MESDSLPTELLRHSPWPETARSELTTLRKGAWTPEEDVLLRKCVEEYGEGRWHLVPSRAGLRRCRKSCRLRWLNYLKPNIKRGAFNADEVDLILRLHRLLGNRWSLIAGRIPGRTANDIKNYWNSCLVKSMAEPVSREHQRCPVSKKSTAAFSAFPASLTTLTLETNIVKATPSTKNNRLFDLQSTKCLRFSSDSNNGGVIPDHHAPTTVIKPRPTAVSKTFYYSYQETIDSSTSCLQESQQKNTTPSVQLNVQKPTLHEESDDQNSLSWWKRLLDIEDDADFDQRQSQKRLSRHEYQEQQLQQPSPLYIAIDQPHNSTILPSEGEQHVSSSHWAGTMLIQGDYDQMLWGDDLFSRNVNHMDGQLTD